VLAGGRIMWSTFSLEKRLESVFQHLSIANMRDVGGKCRELGQFAARCHLIARDRE
jgi:hypothetical protein